MKLASTLVALVSVCVLAGTASAQRIEIQPLPGGRGNGNGNGSGGGFPGQGGFQGDGFLAGSAQNVQQQAELLTQILAREARPNARLVYNAGLLAKEAHDLVMVFQGQQDEALGTLNMEFSDLVNAYDALAQQWSFAQPRPGSFAQNQVQQVIQAVQNLRYEYAQGVDGGGGGGNGGGGNCDPDFQQCFPGNNGQPGQPFPGNGGGQPGQPFPGNGGGQPGQPFPGNGGGQPFPGNGGGQPSPGNGGGQPFPGNGGGQPFPGNGGGQPFPDQGGQVGTDPDFGGNSNPFPPR